MSNSISLDDIRNATKRKFAPVKFSLSDGSEVELRSMLRLPKENREIVSGVLNEFNDLDIDQENPESVAQAVEMLTRLFKSVADLPDELLTDLHDDDADVQLAMMTTVLSRWASETALGEA